MNIGGIETACAWVVALTIGIGVLLSVQGCFAKRPLPRGLKKTVLAMELVGEASQVSQVVGDEGDPDRDRMATQMYLDFVFIAAYTTLFMVVATLLRQRGYGKLVLLIVALAILAAAFDVLENVAILGLLRKASENVPRPWSLAKWGLTFVLLMLIVPAYLGGNGSRLHRLLGMVAVAEALLAAVVGLWGIGSQSDLTLQCGTQFMVADLVTGLLFFATH